MRGPCAPPHLAGSPTAQLSDNLTATQLTDSLPTAQLTDSLPTAQLTTALTTQEATCAPPGASPMLLSDLHAALAPFEAARHFGGQALQPRQPYRWLLWVQDDTLLFLPSLTRLLAPLNHSAPLAVSDNLWLRAKSGEKSPRAAPRCLPCQGPLQAVAGQGQGGTPLVSSSDDAGRPPPLAAASGDDEDDDDEPACQPPAACPYCTPALACSGSGCACASSDDPCAASGAHVRAGIALSWGEWQE